MQILFDDIRERSWKMETFEQRFILELLENKTQESEKIEYKAYEFEKGKFNSLEQKSRNKLFQEVCAFANANGGKIVIGVREDNNHNPIEVQDVKVEKSLFEEWEQSFRLILNTRTRPVLHGVVCSHILLEDNKNIIIIDVPKSIQRPHAYNNGNKDEFYVRYGNICITMAYDQLKRSFLMLDNVQKKVQDFRDDRIGMIVNNEVFSRITDESALIIHIIPEWAMDFENFLDVRKAKYNSKMRIISPEDSQGSIIYNADVISFIYGHGEGAVMSYVQLFHNGIIEAGEIRLLNDYKDNVFYNWEKIEELIAKKMYQYCVGLTELEIPFSFYMFVSLVSVKDKKAKINDFEMSPPLVRDIIKTRVAYWNEGQSYEEAISPLMNSLANAFGMERSTLYNAELEPIVDKFPWLQK